MRPLPSACQAHSDIIPNAEADPSDNQAVNAGIEAYGHRQFSQAFDLLYPVLQKLKPELHYAIKPGERRQPGGVVFTILTQLGDIFPAAQYRAAKSELYGFIGIQVDIVSGLKRLTDAAERGHPEARAHLGQFYVSREKPVAYYWMTLAATPQALVFRDNMALKMSTDDLKFARRLIDDHQAGRPVDFARKVVRDKGPEWPITGRLARVAKAPRRSGIAEGQPEAAPDPNQTAVSPVDKLMSALAIADKDGDRAKRQQLISQASADTLRQVLARIRAAKCEEKL